MYDRFFLFVIFFVCIFWQILVFVPRAKCGGLEPSEVLPLAAGYQLSAVKGVRNSMAPNRKKDGQP